MVYNISKIKLIFIVNFYILFTRIYVPLVFLLYTYEKDVKMMKRKFLVGMSLSLLSAALFVSCGGTQNASKGGSAMPETSTALGSSDLSSAPGTTESGTLKPASSAAVSSGKTTPAKTSASPTKSRTVISFDKEAF